MSDHAISRRSLLQATAVGAGVLALGEVAFDGQSAQAATARTTAAQHKSRSAFRSVAAVILGLGLFAGTGTANATAAAPRALPAGCSGSSPIYCHYDVAPGNYDVTVSIGSATSAASTAMWVEARRLMLDTTKTAAGTVTTYI